MEVDKEKITFKMSHVTYCICSQDTYANLTIKDIAAFEYALMLKREYRYLAIAGDEVVLDLAGT